MKIKVNMAPAYNFCSGCFKFNYFSKIEVIISNNSGIILLYNVNGKKLSKLSLKLL